MGRATTGKGRGLVLLAILVAAVLLAYHFVWPRYSRERYIDPDEVRLVVIPPYEWRDTREVHSDGERRLLRRVIGALNGARSWTRYKLGFVS